MVRRTMTRKCNDRIASCKTRNRRVSLLVLTLATALAACAPKASEPAPAPLVVGGWQAADPSGEGVQVAARYAAAHLSQPHGALVDDLADTMAADENGIRIDVQRRPARLVGELPERPERLRRGEGASLALEVPLGSPLQQGEEQVVHRAEVVVDELRLEVGPGGDPSRRHRRVALLQHEVLGGVEQGTAGRRVLRADPPRAGHAPRSLARRLGAAAGQPRCGMSRIMLSWL